MYLVILRFKLSIKCEISLQQVLIKIKIVMFLTKRGFTVLQINTLYLMLHHVNFCICQNENVITIDMPCFGAESKCFYKQKLDCSYKNITFLNLRCENSRIIKVLDYSNNAISYIKEDTFENVTNLQHLYLNDNEINRIEEHTFRSLEKIQYLHLSNNNIEEIHRNSFRNLSNLLFIDLEDNQLTAINDDVFTNCNSLWQVHLAKNRIKKIQENSFQKNCSLKHLYCSHNEIKTLEFLKNLPRLFFLDLSYNRIQMIPTFTFLQTKELKKLNLSYNRLEVLYSGTFSHLPVLTDLNLSHNKLKDLGEGPFDNLYALRALDIRSNCVKLFSYGAKFGQIKNNTLLSIYIDDNNWHCSYIHRMKQLPGIKLIYFNINESVSNIEGIPCQDKVLFLGKSTSTILTTQSSLKTSSDISTIVTTTNTENSTNPTIFMKIINVSTTTIISSEGKTSSTSKQTTHFPIITETLIENNANAVALPDIQIDKSIVFIGATVAVIIILAVVILSIRYYKRCSTASECEYVNDDYLMETLPPKKSNFYITLDAYNEYEEIQINDSDSEKDHIYEKIDE